MRSREDGGTYFTQVKMKNPYTFLVEDLREEITLETMG
jgi:hypothetical protein